MRAPEALEQLAVNLSWSSPSLGGSKDNHGPAWSECLSRVTSFLLVFLDLKDTLLESGGHGLVHALEVTALNKVWGPAITNEQCGQLSVRDTGKNCWVVDLVAIEVENRKDGTIGDGIEEFGAMPTGGKRSGLSFTIADHTESN